MSIELEGIDAIITRLQGTIDKANIEQAMGKACALVEREAKPKAPKDTGELRRSIQSRVETAGNDIKGIVFTPLEYAPYIEYGTGLFAEQGGRKTGWAYEDEKTGETIFTRGSRPHPFLRPALNENRQRIIETIREGVLND